MVANLGVFCKWLVVIRGWVKELPEVLFDGGTLMSDWDLLRESYRMLYIN